MSTATPTPGARVRITIEGTVAEAQKGEVTFANRTHVMWESDDDVTLELLSSGFQVGDVVNDGHRNLLRVQQDGYQCWIAPDGRRVHDDEHDPTRLTLISRASAP